MSHYVKCLFFRLKRWKNRKKSKFVPIKDLEQSRDIYTRFLG